jgi:hypothetical protein
MLRAPASSTWIEDTPIHRQPLLHPAGHKSLSEDRTRPVRLKRPGIGIETLAQVS